jgi:lipid-A-disaccharide synthase
MVVGYRLTAFSHAILSRMIRIPHVALPNLLAREALVPELLQDDASPETLGAAVLERLENGAERARLKLAFTDLHNQLRQNADERAATAISELVERRSAQ